MNSKRNQRITVYVDDEPCRLFLGLQVRHALGYGRAWRVERQDAVVEDRAGNRVDLDAALHDGERLFVRPV
jgi:hypothetical protein